MRALATSDIHLTDRPRDEYRFEIFDWLRKQAVNAEDRGEDFDTCLILGDITDSKDHHPARLTNRIADELVKLARHFPDGVHVLMGNHDYTDPTTPFFRFLDGLKGVRFHTEPTFTHFPSGWGIGGPPAEERHKVLFLPHTRSHTVWEKHADVPGWIEEADLICVHQTFRGAKASNGMEMKGMSVKVLGPDKTKATVLAGDIHVPQKIGSITYCGAPHPITFGDSYDPRVLVYDSDAPKTLTSRPRITVRKGVLEAHSLLDLARAEFQKNDQVKVRFHLPRAEFPQWEDVRDDAIAELEEKGVIVHSIELVEAGELIETDEEVADPDQRLTSPAEILAGYVEAEGVDESLVPYAENTLSNLQ